MFFGGGFQISSDSHKTRRRPGFMFKLGQKRRRRFAKGIFVWWLLLAVALMSSIKVKSKSRFSLGSRVIRPASAWIDDCEGGGTPTKVGIARVDSEGGFLIWMPLFGLDGREGPMLPIPRAELLVA